LQACAGVFEVFGATPRAGTIEMTDFGSFTEMTARDPLAAGFVIIAVGMLVSRLLFRQHAAWRAVARVIFLILLTLLMLQSGIVPYQPLQSTAEPLHDAIVTILKIAWWLWAAWLAVGLIRSVVVFERRPREGKLVQDLLSALIYLAAAFAIIAYVFGLPVQGLLATSGAIAIVLGLALQSTLNDVFSGLLLSVSRPFRTGDWIKIDDMEGQVVEMNWRATHVLTRKRDLAILPNSTMAKSKIVNLNFPSGVHGIVVTIGLVCPPAAGTTVLQLALLNSRSVLAVPKPAIRVVSIEADQTNFEVTAFVERLGSAAEAQNELFDLIYRHATAAGVRFASSKDRSPQQREDEGARIERRDPKNVLDIVSIFATLRPGERAEIAAKLKPTSYEKGDVLVEPATVLQSLFIVGEGVLSVTGKDNAGETEVLRFGPGDHYGEIGMLTGNPAGANITALAFSTVYELAKADLAPILEARPQIAGELSHALAQRQAAGRALTAAGIDKDESRRRLGSWFFERLHTLFEREVSG
jgi:small-conductance mechanosensitive channel